MDEDRIHRVVSIDGVEIAARVQGQGPPLVMLAGGPGDGEFSFRFLVPHLAEHVTCYPMSTRGKGLSGPSEDFSMDLLAADVRTLVESIGEPAVLMGWSSTCPLVMEVAATTDALAAVVLFEPTFLALRSPEVEARQTSGVERMIAAMGEGRMIDASRAFFEDVGMAEERELPFLEASGAFESAAPNLGVMIQEVLGGAAGVMSDMALLEQVSVPVLLAHGTTSEPFFASVVNQLTERIPDPHVAVLEGVGHFAPAVAPEPLAAEILRFLTGAGLVRG